jgi:hypothetical protein
MKIRLIDLLGSGAPYVIPVLLRTLASLPKDPAGSHTLHALGANVKIAIEIGKRVGDPFDGAEIELHARDAAAAFPVFHGTLRVEARDTFSSRLVLAGQYSVPLGVIGTAADRTVLAGSAKRSLRALLGGIRAQVAASLIPA